jgi:hypothetical protein
MFNRVTKLFSQLAMGDKHKSDHEMLPCTRILTAGLSQCRNYVHQWAAILVMKI